LDRAKSFYESVLNVSLKELGDPTDSSIKMLAFPSDMEAYGASGALVKTQDVSTNGFHVKFLNQLS
jgi:predicted enzyme related to lactoylglutathione lyase